MTTFALWTRVLTSVASSVSYCMRDRSRDPLNVMKALPGLQEDPLMRMLVCFTRFKLMSSWANLLVASAMATMKGIDLDIEGFGEAIHMGDLNIVSVKVK
jgi:hypothetical protein